MNAIWHSPCTQKEIDNIDLKTAKALHKGYWSYIYNLGLLYKPLIADKYDNFINVPNGCFACAYAHKVSKETCLCKHCPIKKYRQMMKDKPYLPAPCALAYEPFDRFANHRLPYEERIKAALEVANLEFISEEEK